MRPPGKSPAKKSKLSASAMQTIRRRMADLARELASNEEISGVDEALLTKLFETKAKDLLS